MQFLGGCIKRKEHASQLTPACMACWCKIKIYESMHWEVGTRTKGYRWKADLVLDYKCMHWGQIWMAGWSSNVCMFLIRNTTVYHLIISIYKTESSNDRLMPEMYVLPKWSQAGRWPMRHYNYFWRNELCRSVVDLIYQIYDIRISQWIISSASEEKTN